MARNNRKATVRREGYVAYAFLDTFKKIVTEENGQRTEKIKKITKWQKVGHVAGSQYAALSEARAKYGPNVKIRVEGVRVDIRPFYIHNGEVVYGEYKPGPKQPDYSCFSSRTGKI